MVSHSFHVFSLNGLKLNEIVYILHRDTIAHIENKRTADICDTAKCNLGVLALRPILAKVAVAACGYTGRL